MNIMLIVFLMAIFLYLIVSIKVFKLFNEYCERVAKLQGRQSEMHDVFSEIEGGGINAFKREQLENILFGNFCYLDDTGLLRLGARLRPLLLMVIIFTIALVIAFAVLSRLNIFG
jgi:ABC-type uncharacterized transport system substrate-binding protein